MSQQLNRRGIPLSPSLLGLALWTKGIVSNTTSEKSDSIYLEEPDVIRQASLLSAEAVNALFDRSPTQANQVSCNFRSLTKSSYVVSGKSQTTKLTDGE